MMGCGASSAARVNDPHFMPSTQHPIQSNRLEIDAEPINFENGLKGLPKLPSSMETSADALRQFIELESAISECEKRFQSENFHVKSEQLDQVEQMMVQMASTKDQAIADADKLRSQLRQNDLQSTKDFLIKMTSNNNESSEEDKRLLELLNKQEIAELEFTSIVKQRDQIRKDMDAMKRKGEMLNELHTKRDAILDVVFEGQYGSEVEQTLERELDWLLEQRHHVDQAHFRWKAALIEVDNSFQQISKAIEKWKRLSTTRDFDKKYSLVVETRNLLVYSNQSIYAALRYLPNIEIPYCSTEDMNGLDKAIKFIFLDIPTPSKQDHALACFHTTYKRINALKQWLNQVVNTTIQRDTLEVQEACNAKATELRNERIQLIRTKVKEETGRDSNDLLSFNDTRPPRSDRPNFGQSTVDKATNILTRVPTDSGFDSELEESVGTDELRRLFSQGSGKSSTPDPTPRPLIMPTPIPSADLAPLPSTEEIFGKIELLRRRYKQDLLEYTRSQRVNQARISQGLKDKLNQRRNRRSRLEMHSRQQEALQAFTKYP